MNRTEESKRETERRRNGNPKGREAEIRCGSYAGLAFPCLVVSPRPILQLLYEKSLVGFADLRISTNRWECAGWVVVSLHSFDFCFVCVYFSSFFGWNEGFVLDLFELLRFCIWEWRSVNQFFP